MSMMFRCVGVGIILLLGLSTCGTKQEAKPAVARASADTALQNTTAIDTSALERKLLAYGLQNIRGVDSLILVKLMYSTSQNFMKQDVYGALENCYLQPSVAKMLAKSDSLLQAERPDLRLLVYDCVRPLSVQRTMWAIVKNTPNQRYVADPSPANKGSMHNYGCAVDVTLATAQGKPLDMGTPYDFFGPKAQPRFEQKLLATGSLTQAQYENRMLLRRVMREGGFVGILTEWWHFDAGRKDSVSKWYKIVE